MKENWDNCFQMILKNEGLGASKKNPWGFVDDPRDPGGPTQLGVTQRAWEEYLGHAVTIDDMKALRPDTVKPFYKAKYWDKLRGDLLPSGVDYAAVDYAVNSGVTRAAKSLQEIAGVPADGIIGPKSLEAILAVPPDEMIDAICLLRLQFVKRLATWTTFGKGWAARIESVEKASAQMAKTA